MSTQSSWTWTVQFHTEVQYFINACSDYLEVLNHNVDAVLGLAVPVAPSAHVVAAVLGLRPVDGQRVVKQNPHPGTPVQRIAILQPGDAGPDAAVDIAGYSNE